MSVRVEKDGPLTTVVLDRPGRKNAVDRETAQLLADAFRAFEADDAARVAVLWGDHGAFCAEAPEGARGLARGAGRHGAKAGPEREP
jgi:enoyl-CoA hydratase